MNTQTADTAGGGDDASKHTESHACLFCVNMQDSYLDDLIQTKMLQITNNKSEKNLSLATQNTDAKIHPCLCRVGSGRRGRITAGHAVT